ncbi:MAG: protein-methionine-sulfoxide reductase catalytic subunit MsrP [Planctomycetota bacterium]|nr:MAG: protein-methionine-sulfoxide reductase catalytic subunit MsrP [Planctomycetota bacterium]
MANRRRPWDRGAGPLTDAEVYFSRRRFVKALGLGGLAAGGLAWGGRRLVEVAVAEEAAKTPPLKAPRNPAYADAGRPLTGAEHALRYNNFYEFSTSKERVWRLAKDFCLDPYSLEVAGLVERPGVLSLEQVEALGLEERVYRFRCVEAWAMTVPWIGVPLRKLLEHVGVRSEARYVAFTSFLDPKQAPGQREGSHYPWPYFEALRLDEAAHDLTLVATGVYGRRLPPQSGAPLRIVVPWKYGYKSPKSVVKMTFTKKRPPTFWNQLQPDEYSWLSNVNPEVPHPRWSQKTERVLGTGARRPTLPYNGYGEQVARLYRKG